MPHTSKPCAIKVAAATPIPQAAIHDGRLSWGSRGLLTFLLTLEDGSTISLRSLLAASPDGRQRLKRHLSELIEAGFLLQTADGWTVTDTPNHFQ